MRSNNLSVKEKCSCNLATILSRDREVVAVKLDILLDGCKIYISKNSFWLKEDIIYIKKIQEYLRNISNNGSLKGVEVEGKSLISYMMSYCATKLESRFNKFLGKI